MGHKVGVPDQQISLGCVRGRRICLLEDQAEAPVSEASGEDGVAGGSGATTSEQTREHFQRVWDKILCRGSRRQGRGMEDTVNLLSTALCGVIFPPSAGLVREGGERFFGQVREGPFPLLQH